MWFDNCYFESVALIGCHSSHLKSKPLSLFGEYICLVILCIYAVHFIYHSLAFLVKVIFRVLFIEQILTCILIKVLILQNTTVCSGV